MDRIQKFLRTLSQKELEALQAAIRALVRRKSEGMDIKPLKGHKGVFRCRVGAIRILFQKSSSGEVIIVDIGFRKDVYKRIRIK